MLRYADYNTHSKCYNYICVREVVKVDNQSRVKNLGEIIRTERKSRNITLEELASKLNISSTYLGLIEMGKRGKNINSELLVNIAYIFDLTTDYLLGMEHTTEGNDVVAERDEDFKKLLSLYKLMEERQRSQFIEIAHVLLN